MTHAERYERRKAIAADLAAGTTMEGCVAKYGVSNFIVRMAAADFGVRVPRERKSGKQFSSYSVVADLINTEASLTELGRKYGVTYQRVSQIYEKCLAAGIAVKPRMRGRPIV